MKRALASRLGHVRRLDFGRELSAAAIAWLTVAAPAIAQAPCGSDSICSPAQQACLADPDCDSCDRCGTDGFCHSSVCIEGFCGQGCVFGADFESSGTCPWSGIAPTPATCSDTEIDDCETDVDCGGGQCAKCEDFSSCAVDSDCESGLCDQELCVECLTGEECPGVDTECQFRSCAAGACGMESADEGVECEKGTGECDGAGTCVVGPEVTLITTSTILFGDIQVASTSTAPTIRVRNDGTANLSISSVSKLGSQPGDFTLTGTTPPPDMVVTPDSTASWTLACAPTALGLRTATLRIVSNDSDEPNTDVSLNCTGTQGALVVTTPATPIPFSNTAVGGQSSPVIVTLENTGFSPITINSAPTSAQPTFQVSTGFPLTPPFGLSPGGSTTFSLRFVPNQVGQTNSVITISYDSTTLSIGVYGTGVAPP